MSICNPNLYADGKVCLSVLGTWHGDAAEKWQPSRDGLGAVLLSVLAQILVPEPFFNEPGRGAARGTPAGAAASAAYNADIRAKTLTWAVAGVLAEPPPGFADLARAHFSRLRGPLLTKAAADLRSSPDGPRGRAAARAVDAAASAFAAAFSPPDDAPEPPARKKARSDSD